MVRTFFCPKKETAMRKSQSPQGGAMVRTRRVILIDEADLCLNPLKAGQWFGLWGLN